MAQLLIGRPLGERELRDEGLPAGVHYSLAFAVPSPDNRFVAYGVAASGSEQTILHVLDAATGKDVAAEKPLWAVALEAMTVIG